MDDSIVNATKLPWHEGELELQRKAGVLERMKVVSLRNVRHHLIEQHRQFYPLLPFIIVGTVDAHGDAWATLLSGCPGFLRAPDEKTLSVEARADPFDPAAAGLKSGDSIGILGIQLETRRRNRMNGRIRRIRDDRFDVRVEDSFGNCDRYITRRKVSFTRDPKDQLVSKREDDVLLNNRARSMIEGADALFIASYLDHDDGCRQLDVSHRGGRHGFVNIGRDGCLSVPDFNGNGFFNTLGNIVKNPRSGLLFLGFTTGDMLQLTGDAEVILEGPEISAFQGAERLLKFRPRQIVFRSDAFPIRFSSTEEDLSPNVGLTGNWAEAASRLKLEDLREQWRLFRISRIQVESDAVRSFFLEPVDGDERYAYCPGQYLPIRVVIPGQPEKLIRTYTLSSAPSDSYYRISVKAQGLVSNYLHTLQAGDVLEARAPRGNFSLEDVSRRPIVMLAAGIGITPMMSMLRHLVYETRRVRLPPNAWLFYGARNAAMRPFSDELEDLARKSGSRIKIVRTLSRPSSNDLKFEIPGRLTIEALTSHLPFGDYDFYLCGPTGFMQSLYDGLRKMNVAEERIHFEAFGPASVRRDSLSSSSQSPVPVSFLRSKKEAVWRPEIGSLLDLAESEGLTPPSECRVGQCGTCRTRVISGMVRYETAVEAAHDKDHALLCRARPISDDDTVLILDM